MIIKNFKKKIILWKFSNLLYNRENKYYVEPQASFKDDVSEQLKLDMDSINAKKTNHTYDADYRMQHNCTWWYHNAHENEDMVVYAPFHPNIGYYYQLVRTRQQLLKQKL